MLFVERPTHVAPRQIEKRSHITSKVRLFDLIPPLYLPATKWWKTPSFGCRRVLSRSREMEKQ
jgi:hypothetical protein